MVAGPGAATHNTHCGLPQQKTGPGYRIHVAILLNPGVPHRDSLTKYAAAFFKMSLSCFNCAFSVRNRVSSACTSVTSEHCPLRENGCPRRTRRTQLLKVLLDISNLRATSTTERPPSNT